LDAAIPGGYYGMAPSNGAVGPSSKHGVSLTGVTLMSKCNSAAIVPGTEFCEEFVGGMRNRMAVSFHKYGPVAEAYPHRVDAIGSLSVRLQKYVETGNTEWLIDVANFAMIEFMHPRHPDAHFQGTDDDASPGRVSLKTGKDDKRGNREIGTNPNSRLAQFR
jgi:hypothetical protein